MNWYPAEESDDERADRMGRPLSNLVISTPGLGPAPEAALASTPPPQPVAQQRAAASLPKDKPHASEWSFNKPKATP